MKRSTIAATLLAAALLIFVFFKFSSKSSTQPFNIIGEWQLDSIYATQPNDSLGQLLTAIGNKADNKSFLRFSADSTVTQFSSSDSTTGKYYVRDSVLYLNDGKSILSYFFQTMTDSRVVMITKDSVGLILKKK
jgi:hypothetical protein